MTNDDIKKELEIKQVNPKFRLFLLIFCNWLWTGLLVFLGGGWADWFYDISFFAKHIYIIWILVGIFGILSIFVYYFSKHIGIKYLPKDLHDHYLKKNNNQLEKMNNFEIINVTQLFNITPICKEIYSKKSKFIKNDFTELSWFDKSKNRLVVNGKINDCEFSWGIVSKLKKKNFKIFLLAILYFGPLLGIGMWFIMRIFFNSVDLSKQNKDQIINPANYKKLGCNDLVAKNIGAINSENYLIFSAKLPKQNDVITLITNNNKQYDWPINFSKTQKKELEDLIKEMEYLPNIYIHQDNISIMMKKYHYNEKDNNELQTWELLKQENSNNEIQFNYLNNAIKIYHIFNQTNSN